MTTASLAKRWYLNGTGYAGGRSGEISKTLYSHITMNTAFGCLTFDWTQEKTGKMKSVSFFSRSDYVTDPLHCFVLYLWSTHMKAKLNDDFVHDELCQLNNPSTKINEIFKDFYEANPAGLTLPAGLTSKVSF
jgi:hypothetical protein